MLDNGALRQAAQVNPDGIEPPRLLAVEERLHGNRSPTVLVAEVHVERRIQKVERPPAVRRGACDHDDDVSQKVRRGSELHHETLGRRRRRSSAGQSTALVKRGSGVRIPPSA